MSLNTLNKVPSDNKLRLLLRSSFVAIIIVYPLIMMLFTLSNYPVFFTESQLSFSGEIIKQHHAQMTSKDLNLYLVAQLFDFIFMAVYGTLAFSGVLTISRRFDLTSNWRNSGNITAIIGIFAAICDATENLFILLMLMDPDGFPDIFAIIHSVFALIKFIFLVYVIIWVILALIKLKTSKNNADKDVNK